MLRSHRGSCATLALTLSAALAAVASSDARGEEPRHEHQAPERPRQAARHEAEARPSHHSYATHAQAFHPSAPGRMTSVPPHPVSSNYPVTPARGVRGGLHESPQAPIGGQVRTVHYGNSVGTTVERPIRPGLVSRTFVSSGHVLYTRVYQTHVWHQFGRAFSYETFVPAVRYPAVYYSWALAAWPHPVTYAWGWRAQPWYPMYGFAFTPYPVYSSPDLWMTDYIIAQSMQTAYTAQA